VLAPTRTGEGEEADASAGGCPVRALEGTPPVLAAHMLAEFVEVQRDTALTAAPRRKCVS
jgi:hypothetical protein